METPSMPQPAKRAGENDSAVARTVARLAEQKQLDFELEFYSSILKRHGDFVDVLRAYANTLTQKGRHAEGLVVDQHLVQLKPNDALAHYNLACSYALLQRPDYALRTLRKAIELGYRDFRFIRDDKDLESIRHDPRFKQLLREF